MPARPPVRPALAAASAVLLCLALVLPGAAGYSTSEHRFHSVLPLGWEHFLVQPHDRVVSLLVAAESSSFQGMRRAGLPPRSVLFTPEGNRVRHYPRFVDFRVTATARLARIPHAEAYPLRVDEPLDTFLLSLRFRVRVFRGLKATTLQPAVVRLIGMPADVPYDERIYRISFDLGEVDIRDRVAFEVLDPGGGRLVKFTLDLL